MKIPTAEERLTHLLAQLGSSEEERLEWLLPLIGKGGFCRGCAQPIFWVLHRNGKRTPYTGNGPNIGCNHFIDCPKRENFRR